jgi:hypothetical protein
MTAGASWYFRGFPEYAIAAQKSRRVNLVIAGIPRLVTRRSSRSWQHNQDKLIIGLWFA